MKCVVNVKETATQQDKNQQKKNLVSQFFLYENMNMMGIYQ